MKLLVYSAKDFEIPFLSSANKNIHKVTYTKDALDSETAIQAVGHNGGFHIFPGMMLRPLFWKSYGI